MRWATLVLFTLWACNDLREFRGDWRGALVSQPNSELDNKDDVDFHFPTSVAARLTIDAIDSHGLGAARLTIDGVLPETPITSVAGAEADVLAGITFGGSPLRVYLAFVPMPDGGGNALAVISLYDDHRVEVRLLRGKPVSLYAIFALTEPAP